MKPTTMPVEWIDTPAQNAGTTIETIREPGKADRKRRYRLHILEQMHRGGRISRRQMLAGMELHEAWCATQLSPPAVREVVVDGTMDPDRITVAQVEAMQRYADLAAAVPAAQRYVVRHVVLDNRAIRDGLARDSMEAHGPTAELKVALELVANRLGYG